MGIVAGRWMEMGITMEYRWEREWEYDNERTGMGGNGYEKLIVAHL
jgi:hypothetical protein